MEKWKTTGPVPNDPQEKTVNGKKKILLVWNVQTMVNDTLNGDTHQAIRTRS
jgi:hypothetical protein